MSNDRISAVGANISEKATMIWNAVDMLRGPFRPHEYDLAILPMTVMKRFVLKCLASFGPDALGA